MKHPHRQYGGRGREGFKADTTNPIVSSDPLQNILPRLDGVKQINSGQWQARCPAHDDRSPSLSLTHGADGRALVRCWAGCSALEVVHSMGLELSDLFAQPVQHRSKPVQDRHRQNYRMILQLLDRELQIVVMCAEIMDSGEPLSERGQKSLSRAYKNIMKALKVANV